jgi:hypothetical protein
MPVIVPDELEIETAYTQLCRILSQS